MTLPRLTLRASALALALGAGLTAPAQAFDLTAMSEAEREAFRGEIRSYLLENPEVIMEAIDVLETRQAEAQEDNDRQLVQVNSDDIFNDGFSWVGGNPEGDLTLVEFMDYRCGYCQRAYEEVEQLIENDGNIRLIVKEFPILGEQSVLASRFAIAVKQLHGDEAYKQAHDALITFKGNVGLQSLTRLAESLGHDADAILTRMNDESVSAEIQSGRDLAGRLQISGTPTFVFEDRMLRGYVPLEGMEQIAAQIRAE